MQAGALPETCCSTAGDGVRSAATLWLWAGHAVYRGRSLELDFHSGSVLCFGLGIDEPFTLVDAGSRSSFVRTAAVAPREVHRIDSHGGRMLFAYFDPGASRARAILERMGVVEGGIGTDHEAEGELLGLASAPTTDPRAIVRCIAGPAPELDDPRIRDTLEMIRAKPGASLAAADVAAAVNLSTSRFLHLFSAQAGTSFRRYRLWARMLHVGEAVAEGSDLTRASIEAGFASPSHFSDSFHAMFGLSAASLLSNGTHVVVVDR